MACKHHWIIASPDGRPFVEGQCRLCGEKRMHKTGFIGYDIWDASDESVRIAIAKKERPTYA